MPMHFTSKFQKDAEYLDSIGIAGTIFNEIIDGMPPDSKSSNKLVKAWAKYGFSICKWTPVFGIFTLMEVNEKLIEDGTSPWLWILYQGVSVGIMGIISLSL